MINGHFSEHWRTAGIPAGGVSSGRGFTISWQNGPLGVGTQRREPNGAFVEDVIQAVISRINEYQDSCFSCDENALALYHLRLAAEALDSRTTRRQAEAVEGTHRVGK